MERTDGTEHRAPSAAIGEVLAACREGRDTVRGVLAGPPRPGLFEHAGRAWLDHARDLEETLLGFAAQLDRQP